MSVSQFLAWTPTDSRYVKRLRFALFFCRLPAALVPKVRKKVANRCETRFYNIFRRLCLCFTNLAVYIAIMSTKDNKKTLILGASANPERYSFLALNRLLNAGHEVVAIGKTKTVINGVPINTEQKPYSGIHTVTLYLNPDHQKEYYQYILSLHPKRIIFNPGAENEELQSLAQEKGIETMNACTLVLLSTGQY